MKICMIGAGYVGLVSGSCFADLGNSVWIVVRIPESCVVMLFRMSPGQLKTQTWQAKYAKISRLSATDFQLIMMTMRFI